MNRFVPAPDHDHGPALARDFAELARVLKAEDDRLATLQTVCELAAKVIRADHASLSVRRGTTFRTIAATGPVPEAVDRLQAETGEGPSLDVTLDHEPFVTGDLATVTSWPSFAPRAVAETGVRSLLCHRLFVREGTLGFFTVHADRPNAYSPDDVLVSGIFAAHAAISVQAAQEQERADNLEIALRHSRRIGTAIGILMHSRRVDEQAAFDLLRTHSQKVNRKLHEVADEVVYTGVL